MTRQGGAVVFWQHVERPKNAERSAAGRAQCWPWKGERNGKYGVTRWRNRPVRAHRASYRLAHGVWPPDGWQVHHLCLNPACVNPHHLLALPAELHRKVHEALALAEAMK